MTYRIDLTPEKQRIIEAAAARLGVPVEAFIVRGAEELAHEEELQAIEDAEDLADVRTRLADTSKPNIPWEQVKAEMGLA